MGCKFMIMLSTKSLSAGFFNKKGNILLVEKLDMEVSPGSLCVIIGRNGTGKTTLIRTISGLHPALKGEVMLAGKPLSTFSSQERAKKMAMVNTARFELGFFTVADLVALGRHPYTGFMGYLDDEDRQIVDEAISSVGIEMLRNKSMNQLSDGEHQKVMIARALAQSTPLLLLDEPTAHLDLINRIDVFQLLKKLCKEKEVTILLSTHELESALSIADQLVVLGGKGKAIVDTPKNLVDSGALEKIFAHEAIRFDRDSGRFVF